MANYLSHVESIATVFLFVTLIFYDDFVNSSLTAASTPSCFLDASRNCG